MMKQEFVFGVGTSALQIEESGEHDWKGLKAKDGSVPDKNTEHLKHWEKDYKLIKELGVQAYRASVDWSKLQSKPYGDLNQKTVKKYSEMFQYLKDNNIELFLVLHHFANPSWFTQKKGWENKESINIFKDYALKTTEAFKNYTNKIITMNEPMTDISYRYITGFAPPHKKRAYGKSLKALRNMAKAHKEAYKALKQEHPDKQVSFTEVQRPIEPHNNTIMEKLLSRIIEYVTNKYTWKKMMGGKPYADFIGMQYYGPYSLNLKNKEDPLKYIQEKPHDKLWELNPSLIMPISRKLKKKYDLPLYITENGTCTENDSLREEQLKETIKIIMEANKEKKIIQGYFHWSLTDNFELDRGITYPFGLVNINFKTMERTPKQSYHAYKKIIEGHLNITP